VRLGLDQNQSIVFSGRVASTGCRSRQGRIVFDGTDLTAIDEKVYRRLRGGRIALITQNPMTSLDPVVPVGRQIDQTAELHLGLSRKAAKARTIEFPLRPRQTPGGGL